MAMLSNDPIAGFTQLPGEGFSGYLYRTDKLLKDLLDTAAALPEGQYKGTVLSFPVADGKAMYLVQKTRPLTLQHIPFGDAWEIPAAHLRGLNMDDVKEHANRNKAMRALFSRNK
jgi:hypothetical protein